MGDTNSRSFKQVLCVLVNLDPINLRLEVRNDFLRQVIACKEERGWKISEIFRNFLKDFED